MLKHLCLSVSMQSARLADFYLQGDESFCKVVPVCETWWMETNSYFSEKAAKRESSVFAIVVLLKSYECALNNFGILIL